MADWENSCVACVKKWSSVFNTAATPVIARGKTSQANKSPFEHC